MPFSAEPDSYGQSLPFAIIWSGRPDVTGGIVSRAQGLNARLLQRNFFRRFENVDVHRPMFLTLFGQLLPDAIGLTAPDRPQMPMGR